MTTHPLKWRGQFPTSREVEIAARWAAERLGVPADSSPRDVAAIVTRLRRTTFLGHAAKIMLFARRLLERKNGRSTNTRSLTREYLNEFMCLCEEYNRKWAATARAAETRTGKARRRTTALVHEVRSRRPGLSQEAAYRHIGEREGVQPGSVKKRVLRYPDLRNAATKK